jgi:ribosomal protein L31E
MFCTTVDERLNQSLWMRQIQPKLIDNPRPEIVAVKLQEHLQTDNTHRTKTAINKIVENLFDARQ